MLATVHSATLSGIDSIAVEVQAYFGKGMPGIEIVGLGDTAVRESRVRVKSAFGRGRAERSRNAGCR